jgi:hypothetical protein
MGWSSAVSRMMIAVFTVAGTALVEKTGAMSTRPLTRAARSTSVCGEPGAKRSNGTEMVGCGG